MLAVGLTVEPADVRASLARWRRIAALSLLPLVTLLPLAVLLGLLFASPEQDGLVALGLASTEVAAAGLVALAGGNAALALTVVSASLVVAALVAPLAAPLLVEGSAETGELVIRFSAVVLVPLAVALALRAGGRRRGVVPIAERSTGFILALLVYASLGDVKEPSELGAAVLAAALFLAGSAALAAAFVARRRAAGGRTGAFVFALRDFAVAAALASQFDARGAAATAAVYGAIMLVSAAVAAEVLHRRATRAAGRAA